jgi:hypothetical protein
MRFCPPGKEGAMGKIGIAERIVRVVVGIVVLALVFMGPKTAWGWLGVLPLATGAVGWCPLYSVLKIGSKPHAA